MSHRITPRRTCGSTSPPRELLLRRTRRYGNARCAHVIGSKGYCHRKRYPAPTGWRGNGNRRRKIEAGPEPGRRRSAARGWPDTGRLPSRPGESLLAHSSACRRYPLPFRRRGSDGKTVTECLSNTHPANPPFHFPHKVFGPESRGPVTRRISDVRIRAVVGNCPKAAQVPTPARKRNQVTQQHPPPQPVSSHRPRDPTVAGQAASLHRLPRRIRRR